MNLEAFRSPPCCAVIPTGGFDDDAAGTAYSLPGAT